MFWVALNPVGFWYWAPMKEFLLEHKILSRLNPIPMYSERGKTYHKLKKKQRARLEALCLSMKMTPITQFHP